MFRIYPIWVFFEKFALSFEMLVVRFKILIRGFKSDIKIRKGTLHQTHIRTKFSCSILGGCVVGL